MKSRKVMMMVCAMVALLAFEACKKEVSVEKLRQSFVESVVAEQRDSGNTLTVDTFFLNKTTGDNFAGELRGHVNDTTEVVYDLSVVDEGEDLSLEWNLRE